MLMLLIEIGAIVAGKSGTPLKVLAIDTDGDLILQKPDLSEVVAKRSAIIEILEPPTPKPSPTAIQIGDRLRRMPAKRTPYPAGWFGKDAAGNPLPDMRPPFPSWWPQ
jgi:hypothetical protein